MKGSEKNKTFTPNLVEGAENVKEKSRIIMTKTLPRCQQVTGRVPLTEPQ